MANKSRGLDMASRGVGRKASSRLVLSVMAKSNGPYSSAFGSSALENDADDGDVLRHVGRAVERRRAKDIVRSCVENATNTLGAVAASSRE